MVFCTKCESKYHGTSVECQKSEEENQDEEEEEPEMSNDMRFFRKMMVSKGARDCHKMFDRWITDMFSFMSKKEQEELKRLYKRRHKQKFAINYGEVYEDLYGPAIMRYFCSWVSPF